MGVALLAGFILFVGVFIDRISTPSEAVAQTLPPGNAKYCQDSKASLAGKGQIIHWNMEGGTLRAVMDHGAERFQVVSIDICSGKILHTMTLEMGASANPAASDNSGLIKLDKPE